MFSTLLQIVKLRCHVSVKTVSDFNPIALTFTIGLSRRICTQYQSKSDGITSAKMEVNGVQIHYETAGKGDHHVLLLPGAIGSTRTDFEQQLLTMDRDKFTVIAMDPRGYGKSIPPERDWPLDYPQRDANDAATLVQNLGISSVSLLGWSDGGIRGMIMAAHYPDLVQKIVHWGCNAYLPDHRDICKGIRDIDIWSYGMRKPFVDLYGEAYFRKIWNEWMDAYDAVRLLTNDNVCLEYLPNIQCPTLVIHGVKDPLVRIDSPEYLHKHTRNSRLYVLILTVEAPLYIYSDIPEMTTASIYIITSDISEMITDCGPVTSLKVSSSSISYTMGVTLKPSPSVSMSLLPLTPPPLSLSSSSSTSSPTSSASSAASSTTSTSEPPPSTSSITWTQIVILVATILGITISIITILKYWNTLVNALRRQCRQTQANDIPTEQSPSPSHSSDSDTEYSELTLFSRKVSTTDFTVNINPPENFTIADIENEEICSGDEVVYKEPVHIESNTGLTADRLTRHHSTPSMNTRSKSQVHTRSKSHKRKHRKAK